MHLLQRLVRRLTQRTPPSLDERTPDLEAYFTQYDLHRATVEAKHAAWFAALPDDIRALLAGKSSATTLISFVKERR